MPGRTRIRGGSCDVDFKQENGASVTAKLHDDYADYCELTVTDKDGKQLHHYADDLGKDMEWEVKWYKK